MRRHRIVREFKELVPIFICYKEFLSIMCASHRGAAKAASGMCSVKNKFLVVYTAWGWGALTLFYIPCKLVLAG